MDYLKLANELDQLDSLSSYKNKFVADENLIYLDGNSLGKLPKQTITSLENVITYEWGNRLIRSWNEKWLDLQKTLASKIAKIIGVKPNEVFVGDTTSLNLYKLIEASINHQTNKNEIITDELNFPSDTYIIKGLLEKYPSNQLKIIKSNDGISTSFNDLEKIISNNTSVLTLSLVTYKSSFLYNMKRVNKLAKKYNALTIWDLSHAVGAVPINLKDTDADMAVGCTYKYLNGGPGSPAFLYVNERLQEKLSNSIWSWFNHEKPFDFSESYIQNKSINKFAISTPSIISLVAIETGLDITIQASINKIREKSIKQSEYLISLIYEYLAPLGFEIASPIDSDERGSHISIKHDKGLAISRALVNPIKNRKVIIPDFRPPNLIRLGITPLYTSFNDLYEAVIRIKEIVSTNEYETFTDDSVIVP